MNGFQINTNVKIKKGKMAYIRKLLRKKEIRMGVMGVGAIAIITALVLMFLAFVPVIRITKTQLVSCEKTFNIKGTLEYEVDYYDEEGKLSETVRNDGDSENIRIKYKYDDNDNLVKEENYYSGMHYDYVEYIYKDGLLREKKQVLIDSTLVSRVTYQYDTANKDLIKIETEYDTETGEIPATIIEYVYDENKVLVKKIATNIESKKVTTTDFTYEKGNLVKEVRTTPTKTTTISYIYDSEGRVLSKNDSVTVTEYKYNIETVSKWVSVFKKNKIEGK
jgi:hypothetical protein